MSRSPSLPPNCSIRLAQPTDKGMIRSLLETFRREVVPPVSPFEKLLRGSALVLLLLTLVYLAMVVGLQNLLNVLVAPVVVLGLGILAAVWFTWNGEWENFWVVEQEGELIACAKLRNYNRYSLLHDLFVLSEWRTQGIGSCLVAHLAEQANRPLYLTCMPKLVQFYLRLGFVPVSPKHLSPLLQYDLGIPGRLDVVPLVLR